MFFWGHGVYSNCFYSIDATAELTTGRILSRLVNHSTKGTAHPRLVEVDGSPHLCLFASEHLEAEQQILYNYGVKVPFRDLVRCLSLFYCICTR